MILNISRKLRAMPVLSVYRVAVSAFYFMQGLVFASWASRIPDIKNALSLSDAALGGVLFSIPVGQLAAMGISGYLVSKYGSKRVLSIAAVLYPAVLVLLGATGNVWQLSGALFLFGVAANMCNIAINTQGVGVERLYNRSVMASFHGLWSLAGFVGGVVSTFMVSGDISPFYHFCVIAVLAFIVLIALYSSLLPRDESKSYREESTQKKIFTKPDRLIVLLGLIAFGCMVCEGTMFDWSGVYFETVINPPKELVRLGYIAFMFSMATGRFAADRFVTRFGVELIIRISGVVIAMGLLIAIIFPHIIWATIGFLLVGFGVSSIVPMCYSMAGRSTAMKPGIALATVSTIGFFGFLLGPPVIGFISQALNIRWAFVVVACFGLLATLLAPLLKTKPRR